MNNLQKMMSNHPRALAAGEENGADVIHHLAMCSLICTSCADACLAEPMVEKLTRCIQLNLDCADVCAATARVLVRQTEAEGPLRQELLRACAAACRACAVECGRHADMHTHCKICAEHCRQCAEMCESVLKEMETAGN